MGYTTDFEGSVEIKPPLKPEHIAYIKKITEDWHSDVKETLPGNPPDSYCQWRVNDEGTHLGWDGGEKFYNYVEWMEYLTATLFKPWGYTLNGEIHWSGEEGGDLGKIVVKNNVVTTKHGHVSYR